MFEDWLFRLEAERFGMDKNDQAPEGGMNNLDLSLPARRDQGYP
jgi:hypothetical protein